MNYKQGIYVAPIYKIGVTATIPNIVRDKVRGWTDITAYMVSKYSSAEDIIKNEPEYFFGRFNGIKEELRGKVRIKKEWIEAVTNTSHTEDSM